MAGTEIKPRRMLAVILGASQFRFMPMLAHGHAFHNSARDLHNYLKASDGLNLPTSNILSLFDDTRSQGDQLVNLKDFLQATSTELGSVGASAQDLICFYVGHGFFYGPHQDYCLAIRQTTDQIEGPTSIRATDLALVLRTHARFLRKFLILDCCFSAAAYKEFQSSPLEVGRVKFLDEFPQKGTALLCSASAQDPSLAPAGLSRTMFTNSLITVLHEGHVSLGPKLSLSDVGDLIKANLKRTYPDSSVRPEVHSPDQREGDVANVHLFPNPAYTARLIDEARRKAAEEQQRRKPLEAERRVAEERQRLDLFLSKPLATTPVAVTFSHWSIWDILQVLVLSISSLLAFQVITLLVVRAASHGTVPLATLAADPRLSIVAQAAAYAVTLWFIFVVVRRRHQHFREAISWNWPSPSVTLLFFLLGIAIAAVVEGPSRLLPSVQGAPLNNYGYFRDAASASFVLALSLTISPLLEEVFFRGMLYPLLRQKFGLAMGIALTAVTYTVFFPPQLGYAWGAILRIFLFSLACTVIRALTNSLAASFIAHWAYNLWIFAGMWFDSEHFRHLEKMVW